MEVGQVAAARALGRHAAQAVPALLASGLALATLWLISRLAMSAPFPPLALAERLVRITPGDVATLSIEQLGKAGLHLLAAGVTAVLLVAGALIARLVSRLGITVTMVAYAIVLAGAGLSGPNRPGAVVVLWSVALAVGAYGLVLGLTSAPAGWRAVRPGEDAAAEQITRRRALVVTGGAVATILAAGATLGPIVGRARERARRFVLRAPDEPARTPVRRSLPAVEGRPPEVTTAAEHYVVDIDLANPSLDAGSWELEVAGEVDRPLRLDIDALQREFTLVEQASVLTCVSNEVGGPLIGSSAWTGVRLADVLRRAGVRRGANELAFKCADGYTSALSLDDARDPGVLLAIGQNGRPLTRDHGYPCRLRVPSLYGMKNPKWLKQIELRRSHLTAYWVKRGWSDRAVVRTASRIDVASDARVGRPTWIAGVAWAGDRKISAVEVSLDGGETWRRARLQAPLSPLAWTQWAYRFTPRRTGVQTVECRAIDGKGETQDPRSRPPHPSGASGYHAVRLKVT